MKFVFILLATLVGITPVYILFKIYESSQYGASGFLRSVDSSILEKKSYFDLGFDGYYFAGKSEDSLYLGHRKAPAHTIAYSLATGDTSKHLFQLPMKGLADNPASISVSVKYPVTYFFGGQKASITYTSDYSDLQKSTLQESFDRCLPMDDSIFVYRSVSRSGVQLHSENISTSTGTTFNLDSSFDMFSGDGILFSHQNSIGYLYYYMNKILVFNPQLEILHTIRTIDTNSVPKIILQRDTSKITFAEPPLKVNKDADLFRNLLFVLSALKADNEKKQDFLKNDVIDIYDIKTNNYVSSFYIPRMKDLELTDFAVSKDILIALYNNLLVTYEITLQKLPLDP